MERGVFVSVNTASGRATVKLCHGPSIKDLPMS